MPDAIRWLLVIGVVSSALASTAVNATAQRTFVASTGNDANPCSLAAPCRGFAAAVAQTNTGGEVIVLDSAGYGPVTLAQSVSLIASPGVYAGVTVSSGDGLTINGGGAVVTLKGLTVNGQGGNIGINILQANRVNIESCTVSGMGAAGISITAGTVNIADTTVRRNAGNGIEFIGTMLGSVRGTRVEGNSVTGIYIADGATVTISASVSSRHGAFGVRVNNTVAGTTTALIDGLEAIGNAAGVVVNANVAGSESIVHVVRSNLSSNSTSGMQVCCASHAGIAVASLTDSLAARNFDTGVALFAPSASWILTVTNNRIVNSGNTGLMNFNDVGTLRTRGDNTVTDNNVDVSGALTTLGGI